MRDQPLPRTQARDPNLERSKRTLVLATIVTLTAVASTGGTPTSGPVPESKQRATANYGKLPLHFEANQGQTDDQVKFLVRGSGYGLFLTSTESVLVLRKPEAARPGKGVPREEAATTKRSSAPEVLRMKLLGADPRPAIEGREELPGRSHYFIGNDPKKWRTDVPQYARVEYRDVYPGVSLTYYGNQGQLEYDFVVSPGGDPRRIRLGIEGAEQIHVDAGGNLVLSLPGGEVVEKAPVVYQEVDGVRKAVEGRFVLRGRGEVGFEVGAYEADRPLVLDPVLAYSTYLGGSGAELGIGIAVDASGNAYVTGDTQSTNFPTANPVQAAFGGDVDAFVAKLNAGGSALVYSTYLGGSHFEQGSGIAVDSSGNAYVTGVTLSFNFPTANPLQAGNGGGPDAFVVKLNATGSALVYSTYLGGNPGDFGSGIAVDSSGNAYVTGVTLSFNFPTANPLQAAYRGNRDAFVAKLNAAGSALVYSTYLGGNSDDGSGDIAVDASGNAYVTGFTYSTNFPTANPLQAAYRGNRDAFVAKLNASGSALMYSTYLGGSGNDQAWGIAVDASGNAYVTGLTQSTNFPTANPLQATIGGFQDAFVAKLNAAGSALVYSTYLGGSGDDPAVGIAVDTSGNAYVTGSTQSTNFPTANPLQAANGGGYDAFVAKLNAAGSALVYSTYLGGNSDDGSGDIAVDASGNVYVAGFTTSANFPTANPLQAANGGDYDAFVARIGLALPAADLSITKTDGQATVVAGTPVTYTIVASNLGPTPVTGATVTDTFSAALTGVTWTCTPSGGSTCGAASGSGNINQTVNLPAGSSVTFVATGTLSSTAQGSLTNTASIAASGGVSDPNPANNSATDTDTIIPAADLSITKTDGKTSTGAGSPVTYTITVSNAGPGSVTGASVVDNFPASLAGVTWTCTASGGSSCAAASGTGNINQTVNLLVGGTATYVATGTLDINATGTLSNTATVSSGNPDPNTANNSATDNDTIIPAAQLSITKTDGQTTAAPGQTITYTIVASNSGPNPVTGATVADTFPAALSGVTWTCTASAGSGCGSPSGLGNINTTVSLLVGGTATFTATGTVIPNPTSLSNTATITPPPTVNDPNPADNSATATDTLICFSETVVVPDGRLTETTVGTGATVWFAATLRIGNAYSVEFKNLTGTVPPGTLTVFSGNDACSGTSSVIANDTSMTDPPGTGGVARASFTAGGTDTFFRARLVNTTGAPVTISFGWSDLTLFSPAWSTNGSFDTYYSFLNTTGFTLSGTLTLLDTTGAVLSTFPVTVPAGQTASTNTSAMGVTRNRAGTARFVHNGPPGAIVAETAIANFTISPAYVQPVKFQAVREAR